MKRTKPSIINKPKQLKSTEIPKLREKLLEKQNGICPICKRDIKDACLDHSHTKRIKGTGFIRGVLCRTCNVFIAKSENNCARYGIAQNDLPTILRSCAIYLERPHHPYIHPSERPKERKLKKSSYNKLRKSYSGKAKFPEYPKSGRLTKQLKQLFNKYNIEPEFYK
jgi:hypothetical protein